MKSIDNPWGIHGRRPPSFMRLKLVAQLCLAFSSKNQGKSLAISNKMKKDEEIRSNSTASPNLTNIRHPSIDFPASCTRGACIRRVYTHIYTIWIRTAHTTLGDQSTSKFVPDGKMAFEKKGGPTPCIGTHHQARSFRVVRMNMGTSPRR